MSRAIVAVEAAPLLPGETIAVQCPWCNGGPSGRKDSLNITLKDDGRIAYICFRNGCKVSGYIGPAGPRDRTAAPPRPRRAKDPLPIDPYAPLPDGWQELLWDAWKLDEVHVNESCIYKAPEGDRLALSVFGPRAELRGYVLRALPGAATHPKALTYQMDGDAPWLGWSRVTLRKSAHTSVVVVEDLVSAARVSAHGVRSVALNGTNCNVGAVEELMHNAERVYWALDRDAFDTASHYAREYRPWFELSQAVLLEKDVKNMEAEESKLWLQNLLSLPS